MLTDKTLHIRFLYSPIPLSICYETMAWLGAAWKRKRSRNILSVSNWTSAAACFLCNFPPVQSDSGNCQRWKCCSIGETCLDFRSLFSLADRLHSFVAHLISMCDVPRTIGTTYKTIKKGKKRRKMKRNDTGSKINWKFVKFALLLSYDVLASYTRDSHIIEYNIQGGW